MSYLDVLVVSRWTCHGCPGEGSWFLMSEDGDGFCLPPLPQLYRSIRYLVPWLFSTERCRLSRNVRVPHDQLFVGIRLLSPVLILILMLIRSVCVMCSFLISW